MLRRMANLRSRRLCSGSSAANIPRRTNVGIIVIGDEILKGFTHDVNSNFICRRLHSRGVTVRKISVVSDAVDDIAAEVKEFSERFDIVFTTGGIGPTHDDRTFAGIAKAFGEELVLNEELKTVLDKFVKESNISDVDSAVEKFCSIPKSAKLIWPADCDAELAHQTDHNDSDKDSKRKIVFLSKSNANSDADTNGERSVIFPSFQVSNVVSLPGVPSLCERNFEYLENYLFPDGDPFFSCTLFLHKQEIYVERKLSQIASEHRGVSIGSYPIVDNNYFKAKVIVESESHDYGSNAHKQLSKAFKDCLVDFDEQPWKNSAEKLMMFRDKQDSDFQVKIDDALGTIDETLNTYKLDQIALSFNGGKDCTILLHLLRCCIDRYYGPETIIPGFQVLNDDEFPEVCDFVDEISKSYKLNMMRVNASLKDGLAQLKIDHPNIIAVLMGSRRADPNGRFMSSRRQWTDADWPRFFRVCPILDWTYTEVWRTIRGLCVPYCRIYDHGYTSLGSRSVTQPNPALLVDNNGQKRYLPAFRLKDETLERNSRENSRASLNALVSKDDE